MTEQTNNRTIAKNTLMLYIRLGVSMIVALFTSRVILQVLGITDMGIQATVGSTVGFAYFINSALSNGTSRFLTYSLGKGDMQNMKSTFSTVFWVHLGLALILMFIVETVGLWFLHNKLIIPSERMDAAEWCFHLGAMSMVVGMTQVPYSAALTAHERMSMYAYTGMVDVALKLVIVYLLLVFDVDKLKLYSTFYFVTSMSMTLFYRWYCTKNFEECRLQLMFDKEVFKPILKFSGWQLFAQGSMALSGSGIMILLNLFFSPAIVAARGISLQVNGIVSQFMTNFRNAANPQIIKKYAAGDYDGSKKLVLASTKYCYYLMLLMGLPVILLSHELLYVWLGQVPDYADLFLQLVIIQSLFSIFDTGLHQATLAKGDMRKNALSSPMMEFAVFPIVYLLFRLGCSPLALSWAFIVLFALYAFIQKPWILVTVVGYKWTDFPPLYYACLKTTIVATIIPCLFRYYIDTITDNQYIIFISVGFISVISVALAVWTVGIDSEVRSKVIQFVRSKLKK